MKKESLSTLGVLARGALLAGQAGSTLKVFFYSPELTRSVQRHGQGVQGRRRATRWTSPSCRTTT